MNCVCGRSKDSIHCPNCGRSDVYNVKRLEVATLTGTLKGFRCRKCGIEFMEDRPCTAPPSASGAARSVTAAQITSGQAAPDAGALKLIEILKKRGAL